MEKLINESEAYHPCAKHREGDRTVGVVVGSSLTVILRLDRITVMLRVSIYAYPQHYCWFYFILAIFYCLTRTIDVSICMVNVNGVVAVCSM